MLVLARKVNEAVIITVPPSETTQRVKVMLADIRGDKVRIGITASKEVTIHREEIQDEIDSGTIGEDYA